MSNLNQVKIFSFFQSKYFFIVVLVYIYIVLLQFIKKKNLFKKYKDPHDRSRFKCLTTK